jgi:hypothetical protein
MQLLREIGLFWFIAANIVAAGQLECQAETKKLAATTESEDDRVIAIDVLLVPDAAMVKRAEAVNAKLRESYPEGYTLGEMQVPHITLVHRYVREKDLPAIEKAVTKVLEEENPLAWLLTATGIEYGKWGNVAITSIAVKPTPDLGRLQLAVVKAVEPYAVQGGTDRAFSKSKELPKIEPAIVAYVEKFVPNSSGVKYNPHVTVGVAREDFVKQLKAAPFESFSFKPASVAIYQLGSYGTAQKKIWVWKPKPTEREQKTRE